jgi:hypothetical protein
MRRSIILLVVAGVALLLAYYRSGPRKPTGAVLLGEPLSFAPFDKDRDPMQKNRVAPNRSVALSIAILAALVALTISGVLLQRQVPRRPGP